MLIFTLLAVVILFLVTTIFLEWIIRRRQRHNTTQLFRDGNFVGLQDDAADVTNHDDEDTSLLLGDLFLQDSALSSTDRPAIPSALLRDAHLANFPMASDDFLISRNFNRHSVQAQPRKRHPVDCAVYAPPTASWGSMLMVQVFLHNPLEVRRVSSIAHAFDDESNKRGFQTLEVSLTPGSRVGLHLLLPGLKIEQPIREVVWNGSIQSAQFAVDVGSGSGISVIVGTLRVLRREIPIGSVSFKLTISQSADTQSRPLGDSAKSYRTAFTCYASQDRQEVLKRVQGLRSVGIDVFQDILSIDPGVFWQKRIFKAIDDCDLFLLFWSNSARSSKWVKKEVRYALSLNKRRDDNSPDIVPVIIEGPPPVPPPPELKHLQFNDHIAYLIRPEGQKLPITGDAQA